MLCGIDPEALPMNRSVPRSWLFTMMGAVSLYLNGRARRRRQPKPKKSSILPGKICRFTNSATGRLM